MCCLPWPSEGLFGCLTRNKKIDSEGVELEQLSGIVLLLSVHPLIPVLVRSVVSEMQLLTLLWQKMYYCHYRGKLQPHKLCGLHQQRCVAGQVGLRLRSWGSTVLGSVEICLLYVLCHFKALLLVFTGQWFVPIYAARLKGLHEYLIFDRYWRQQSLGVKNFGRFLQDFSLVIKVAILGMDNFDVSDSVSSCVFHCSPKMFTGLLVSATLSLCALSMSRELSEVQLLR